MDYPKALTSLSVDLLVKPWRQLCCGHAFASPAHHEHVTKLSSLVKKVNFAKSIVPKKAGTADP